MSQSSFVILAGDYDRGGLASRSIKEQLKRIGASPQDIRRAMIATYEAEMNVVIHSAGGRLTATIDQGHIEVEVVDDGPGIADVDKAMKEGFSTAPAKARELGFGAGMGLPNIKRNCDRFHIESTLGKGTRLGFTVLFSAQRAAPATPYSVRIDAQRCTHCLRCLRACPTKAIRVRESGPAIRDYLCVDCTACIAACESHALELAGSQAIEYKHSGTIVVPPAILTQFGPSVSPELVADGLRQLGYDRVVVTAAAHQAIRDAAVQAAQASAPNAPTHLPLISPACPAVINLIQTRFASLIPNIAPFAYAVQAVADDISAAAAGDGDAQATFVALCPAQNTLLAAMSPQPRIIVPSQLREALLPVVMELSRSSKAGQTVGDAREAIEQDRAMPVIGEDRRDACPTNSRVADDDRRVLQVFGIHHVTNVLEHVENGLLDGPVLLELYACDEGCFGSPLLTEEPFIARRRWQEASSDFSQKCMAARRKTPLEARRGVRLDENMAKAIEKFAELDRIVKSLPGKDCGLCGCPTCAALAEDVVLGRSQLAACVRLARQQEP